MEILRAVDYDVFLNGKTVMQHPISRQTFSDGPKIALQFLSRETNEIRLHLFKSCTFQVSFFVDFPSPLQKNIVNWLFAYSEKKQPPDLALPNQILPHFSEKVLSSLKDIPFGKTLSYSEIALLSGSPKASRAVGTICRLNPWPLFIPCHRVLPKDGSIGHYAFGSTLKKALLEFENSNSS